MSMNELETYAELITPTIHWFLLASGPGVSGSMLNSAGKDRLAPFDPVSSQPLKVKRLSPDATFIGKEN